VKKKPSVLHFIDEEREKGTSDKDIIHKLLDAGWHMDIIQRALHSGETEPTALPTITTAGIKERLTRSINTLHVIGGIFVLLVLLALYI
jgi:hypothetical protein